MVSMRGLKVPVIILSFAALLFAGLFVQRVLHDARVTEPLQEQLSGLAGVESVKVEEDGGHSNLTVTLGRVDDLGDKYARIVRIATGELGADLGEIELIDRRSPALKEAYYQLHFDLQEAIATGGFGNLERAGREVARKMELADQRIYVHSDYVAVQLFSTDGHYLYEVLPRPSLRFPAGRGRVGM